MAQSAAPAASQALNLLALGNLTALLLYPALS